MNPKEYGEKKRSIKELVEARRKEWGRREDKADASCGDVNPEFVQQCLEANELGDGVLFSIMQKGRFCFLAEEDCWLEFQGHHWERDVTGRAKAAVEAAAVGPYLELVEHLGRKINEALATGDEGEVARLAALQKRVYKRVLRLRSERGRQNCLKFAASNPSAPLAITGEKLDSNPWLLACANGVIDLRTGELRDGRPEDFLTRASPVEWKGIDAPCPVWERTLDEIFGGDQTLVQFLNRALGYGCTGLSTEPAIFVLHGRGRNGKTLITNTIRSVLGPLAGAVDAELLLLSRGRSSSGAAPELLDLRGLRLAFSSEVEEGRRFSAAKIKSLTGDDEIAARGLYQARLMRFRPSHTLILLTNHKPSAPMDDYAFWERVMLIPFELSFVARPPVAEYERRADKYLEKKLEVESSGILAWLVRGCIAWQEQGLNPPEKVREKTEEYRREEDLLADWIEECCHLDPAAKTRASELYDSFKEWWTENVSKHPLSQKVFGQHLVARRGIRRKKSGTSYYQGIRLLADG